VNNRIDVANDPVNWVDPTGEIGVLGVVTGIATVGTATTAAYLGGKAKWGAEINRRTNDAWDLINEDLKNKCPDKDYAQALQDYLHALEKAKFINAWQAIQLGLGATSPLSNLPIIPTPSPNVELPKTP
jgi:hypothetical protein